MEAEVVLRWLRLRGENQWPVFNSRSRAHFLSSRCQEKYFQEMPIWTMTDSFSPRAAMSESRGVLHGIT